MNELVNFLFNKTPLYFLVQSIWRDEAFSYLLAKRSLIDILVLSARDYNPPLYYLILHFWIKIFGFSEVSLRSLSFIFYWATVYIFYLFLINLLKIKSRIFNFLYLLLIITNPLLIYYAFEARMYTMFAFLATLSFYSLLISNRKLHLISTTLGLFTHYFMIVVVLTQLIYLYTVKNFLKERYRSINNFLTSYLLSFACFLPWLVLVIIQKTNLLFQPFWIKRLSLGESLSFLLAVYTGYTKDLNFKDKNLFLFLQLIIVFLIFFLLLKILSAKKEKKKLFFSFGIWAVVLPLLIILISFIVRPIFLPRYLIFSTVGLLLLLVLSLEIMPKNLRILVLLILLVFNFNYNLSQVKYRKKFNIRKIVREIKLLAKKDDLLYVTDVLNFHEAQYYFGEKRVFIYKKSYEEIPHYVGKVLIPKEKIAYYLPTYPIKAFILFPNGHYEVQALF